MLGTIGHLLTIASLVACIATTLAYYFSVQLPHQAASWRRLGRGSWFVVTGSIVSASALLSYFFFTHQFQYAYVWQESSLDLPFHFLLSAFWAGQEGSFLLWIFFMCFMGLALIRWSGSYESPVMAVVAFCQMFLISMIVGLKIGPVEIGSTPFMTIYEKFPSAVNGFIPEDGSGLNDLLQNYWMAIHPPTLFVGFTAMVVPFAYAIAALWTKQYTRWVRPALPWTLFAIVMLGIGIAMGGYWAYETLSFGGYWAWDPVENASLVPWITGVAAIHMMIVQKKSGASHKGALFLCIISYVLVVYSTFLTRSGILGDISVHSFVDLGLYNQLLIWILSMTVIGLGLFALRYQHLPVPRVEPSTLSREFMIFSGALLLCGIAVIITIGTSAPILGRIFRDNPSSVPIEFYSDWSLPLTIGFVFLAGFGQLIWWHKMSMHQMKRIMIRPIALSIASTVLILVFTPFMDVLAGGGHANNTASFAQRANILEGVSSVWSAYGSGILLTLLLFALFFGLYGNALVMWRIGRGNLKLIGGSFTHIGFMIMMLGVLASSGFNNALSDPNDANTDRENTVIARGETKHIDGYEITYTGVKNNEEGLPAYQLTFVDDRQNTFTLNPVVYKSNTDQWIQNPDVKHYADYDLYVAVAPNVMFEAQVKEDTEAASFTLAPSESVFLADQAYAFRFETFDRSVRSPSIPSSAVYVMAAQITVEHLATGETRDLTPLYYVEPSGAQKYVQNRLDDWGLGITFAGIEAGTNQAKFLVQGASLAPEDWIILSAHEKPFINLVWVGIILLSIGFFISMMRRMQDLRFNARRAYGV